MVATCSSVKKAISSGTTDKTWSQASNSVREARTASCVDVRWRWGTGCSELNDGHRPRAHFGVVQWQSKSSNTRSERSRLTAPGAWQRQSISVAAGAAHRLRSGAKRNVRLRDESAGTWYNLGAAISNRTCMDASACNRVGNGKECMRTKRFSERLDEGQSAKRGMGYSMAAMCISARRRAEASGVLLWRWHCLTTRH